MAAAVSRGFAAEPMPDTDEIVLPGEYLSHLQDVCRDDSFVYWAHTQYMAKRVRYAEQNSAELAE